MRRSPAHGARGTVPRPMTRCLRIPWISGPALFPTWGPVFHVKPPLPRFRIFRMRTDCTHPW